MDLPATRWLRKGVNTLLWTSFGLVLAALVWGLDKGFDVTDEAYYLLGLLPGQEKLTTFTALQFTLFSRLFGWLDGMIAFRILSLALTLASAACFAWGFLRLVRRIYPAPLPLSPAALSAWLAGGSFFVAAALTLTFSYNVFINCAMLAQSGLAFYGLASLDGTGKSPRRQAAWAGVGLLGLLGLLVKTPAELAVLLVLLGGGFVFAWPNWREFFREAILPCLLGGLAALAIAFALDAVLPILTTLNARILHPGHHPSELLQSLWQDIKTFFLQLTNAWLPIVAALAAGSWAAWNRRLQRPQPVWAGMLALAVVIAASWVSPLAQNATGNWLRLPVIHVWTVLLAILAGLLVPGFAAAQKSFRLEREVAQKLAWFAMLFLLAPAAAFGTNNTLAWQTWLHITPWMALVFLLFLESQRSPTASPLGWVILVFTIAWAWAGWTQTYFMLPYRLLHDRLSQTVPLEVRSSHFQGLKVDAEASAFFEAYDAILGQSKTPPGAGAIALFDMPGLVYLSDAVSPGDIWYQEGEDRNKEVAGYIRESQMPRKSGLILINTPYGELPDTISQVIGAPEIDFPNAYRQLGRLYDPYNKRTVTVYERRR